MESSKRKSEAIKLTFNKFWNLWAERKNKSETIHDIIPYFSTDISAIGTGDHEKGRNYNEVLQNFKDDFLEIQKPININFKHLIVKLISSTVGLVEAEADLGIFIEKEKLDFQLRFSTTFVLENENWKIIHNHVSMPSDGQNIGEAYPVDKLRAKNNKLKKLVAERTEKLSQKTLLLQKEKEKTEKLLHNILPKKVAKELLLKGTTDPTRFEEVSILFSDFVGFTNIVATIPTKKLIQDLNDIFGTFDDIMDSENIEKIKTIGDAYLSVCGLNEEIEDHAQRCVRASQKMLAYLEERNIKNAIKWQLRIGIHSGPIVAGVVGKKKFAYDIFGDTINIASRIESAGMAGEINVSAYTYYLIHDHFTCKYRGKIYAKGKGDIDMYFIKS